MCPDGERALGEWRLFVSYCSISARNIRGVVVMPLSAPSIRVEKLFAMSWHFVAVAAMAVLAGGDFMAKGWWGGSSHLAQSNLPRRIYTKLVVSPTERSVLMRFSVEVYKAV